MPEYCVTGGTGFIAAYIVKELLHKGYNVRATVRDPGDTEKIGFLLEMDGAKERLKLVKADLLEDGSFDDAVQGVDGVFHTASPVLVPYDENIQANSLTKKTSSLLCWCAQLFDLGTNSKSVIVRQMQETLIDPCIKGTVNVIRSCSKASSVKRVVLTSSCSSIRYCDEAQKVPLNESHWSDPEYCKRYNLWYAYAKTLGEKEAWRLSKELGIDLVVVNPSYVVGPLIAPQPTSTLLMILGIIAGVTDEYPNTMIGFVHIDDVVRAHILAMEESRAAGRLICSSSVVHWSEIIKMLKDKYPSYPMPTKCSDKKGDDTPHSMDTSKINELGLPAFKTVPQMFDDCIKSFQEKGFP